MNGVGLRAGLVCWPPTQAPFVSAGKRRGSTDARPSSTTRRRADVGQRVRGGRVRGLHASHFKEPAGEEHVQEAESNRAAAGNGRAAHPCTKRPARRPRRATNRGGV